MRPGVASGAAGVGVSASNDDYENVGTGSSGVAPREGVLAAIRCSDQHGLQICHC